LVFGSVFVKAVTEIRDTVYAGFPFDHFVNLVSFRFYELDHFRAQLDQIQGSVRSILTLIT